MTYATSNPPNCLIQSVGHAKGAIWVYQSTDVHTDVDAADYFSNGDALGMKVGDIVFVIETDNSYALSLHVVTAVTSGGAATIGAAVTN